MLRENKVEDCESPADEYHQGLEAGSERKGLSLSRAKRSAVNPRLFERQHHKRDYKIPLVQLLQTAHRQELSLSLRPSRSLDSDAQVSYSLFHHNAYSS